MQPNTFFANNIKPKNESYKLIILDIKCKMSAKNLDFIKTKNYFDIYFIFIIFFLRNSMYKIVTLKHNEEAQRQTETIKIIVLLSVLCPALSSVYSIISYSFNV